MKEALAKANKKKEESRALLEEPAVAKLNALDQKLKNKAEEESARTEEDVYREVFIDECNAHLLTSVEKAEGSVIVVLLA